MSILPVLKCQVREEVEHSIWYYLRVSLIIQDNVKCNENQATIDYLLYWKQQQN